MNQQNPHTGHNHAANPQYGSSGSHGYYHDSSSGYRNHQHHSASGSAMSPIVVPSQHIPSSPHSPTSSSSSSRYPPTSPVTSMTYRALPSRSMTPGPGSSSSRLPQGHGSSYYAHPNYPHSPLQPTNPHGHPHQMAGPGQAPSHVPIRPQSTAPYAHHIINNHYGAYQGVLIQPEDPSKPPKVLQCDGCELRFARKHDLNRHRRIHNGEAPYLCGGCNKAFKRSDARKRHWDTDKNCYKKNLESENLV